MKITETVSGSVTSTKQFIWCGNARCEERDGSGALSDGKQFYGLGQVNYASGTPTNYFYNLDHLGSVREMTKTVTGTTTIEAQYAYGPWGEVAKLAGSADSDFQYAGYYKHARSGLNLTLYRAYNSGLGRWISRDPLGESAGVNLYGYVENNPTEFTDPLGLQMLFGGVSKFSGTAGAYSGGNWAPLGTGLGWAGNVPIPGKPPGKQPQGGKNCGGDDDDPPGGGGGGSGGGSSDDESNHFSKCWTKCVKRTKWIGDTYRIVYTDGTFNRSQKFAIWKIKQKQFLKCMAMCLFGIPNPDEGDFGPDIYPDEDTFRF